jgi:hypothetical protein
MGYEDWKAGIAETNTGGGFEAWKAGNEKSGATPPQINHTPAMVDYAYDKYLKTVGGGAQVFDRDAFESSGQAKDWISKGATRTPRSHIEKLKESYARGQENFLIDQDYYAATLAGDTAKADEVYKKWQMSQARDQLDPIVDESSGFINKATYGAANIMPGMIESGKQSVTPMIAGATLAAVAGQMGPQVLAPEELITVPAGIIVGFKLGSTLAWYKQGAGAMAMKMREKGIKKNVADTVGSIAGIPYALIEQMQVNHLIPGVRKAADKVISKSMLKIAAVTAKKYGITLGMETVEEVAQEGIGIVAEDLGALFSGMGMDVSVEELKNKGFRLWNTAKESAQAMAFLPIPGAAVDIRAGVKGKKLVGNLEDAGYNPKQAVSMARMIDEGVVPVTAHRVVVAETITDKHNKTGGSTISRQSGRVINKGYPVGIGAEKVVDGKEITPEIIAEFEAEFAEELVDPARQIGTWYNEEDGKTYLDVVHIAKTEEEAMELGRINNEIAIFSLETGETIPLEFDGTVETAQIKADERKRIAMIEVDDATRQTAEGYGLTVSEAQTKLDNAELRFRKLSEQHDTTYDQEKELTFLSKNRKSLKALLDRDSGPIEGKVLSKQEVMDRVHNLADVLGLDIVKRKAVQKKITGKESLRSMAPAQREQVMMYLEREAKEQGANIESIDSTPVGELMAKLRERKQKPVLTKRDRRGLSKLSGIMHDIKRGLTYYFLNNSRVRRISRAMDNYEEDGPFYRYIFKPIREAEAKAASQYTAVMEGMMDSFDQQGIDVPAMMIEVVDIGLKDKISTAERIGVYALSLNEKTRHHLLATYSEEEIETIVNSVKGNEHEMAVQADIAAYFEHGYAEFEAIAKATGIKGLVKEKNYMTAFIIDREGLDTTNYMEGLVEQFGSKGKVPGEERAITRKHGAQRHLETNIFVIHARAAKSIERFKAMAPPAHRVGSILQHRGFKNNFNNVTYGHGTALIDKWLQDSVRGKAAYDHSRLAPALRWLRTSSMNFVVGAKITVAGKQGVSLIQGMMPSPKMVPLVLANFAKSFTPAGKIMQAEVKKKSPMMKTRDWNRDLRAAWNKKSVRKFYQGKKLSPILMRMAMNIDQHTTSAVWYSAYQLSKSEGMNEKESIQFADGVVQDTQPMANAVDLPTYFRGSELEKTLTIFQNQVNQNGQMLWYNIFGERKAKKISNADMAYRLMITQIIPSYVLGVMTRGRFTGDPKEIASDLALHLMSPFFAIGKLVYNVATGDWGPGGNIALTPAIETGKMVKAVKGGDPKKIAKTTARTIGAWSGGRVPLQAVTTAEGAWNLATGETEDFRELVWSKYALKSGNKSKKTTEVKY